jgi:ligand-binding SRPBCC domain-containing protein
VNRVNVGAFSGKEALVEMRVHVETWIRAPAGACFDAARDLDLHVTSLSHTSEQAVAGKMSGLIGMGETVTWQGRHFGIKQHFTSKITAFDPPNYFQDTMQHGAFASFVHDHYFVARDGGTLMRDVVEFTAPLGLIGRLVEALVLHRYLRRLLTVRATIIKETVEMTQSRSTA